MSWCHKDDAIWPVSEHAVSKVDEITSNSGQACNSPQWQPYIKIFYLHPFSMIMEILHFRNQTLQSGWRCASILHGRLSLFMSLKGQVITTTEDFNWFSGCLRIMTRNIGMKKFQNINHVFFVLLILSENTKVNLWKVENCSYTSISLAWLITCNSSPGDGVTQYCFFC